MEKSRCAGRGDVICNGFCRTFSRKRAENQVALTDPGGLKWRQMSERWWFMARADAFCVLLTSSDQHKSTLEISTTLARQSLNHFIT